MRNSTHHVLEELLADLRSGRFPLQSRLPTERELTGRFGTARGTVRRALAQLAELGYLDVRPRQGAFVKGMPSSEHGVPDISPAQILEARVLIEGNLADLLVRHVTDADLSAMANALDMHESATDRSSLEHWDVAFHKAMIAATHNQIVVRFYEIIAGARLRERWGALKSTRTGAQHIRRYQRQHRDLLRAIGDRDGAAIQASIRAHLESVWNDVVRE